MDINNINNIIFPMWWGKQNSLKNILIAHFKKQAALARISFISILSTLNLQHVSLRPLCTYPGIYCPWYSPWCFCLVIVLVGQILHQSEGSPAYRFCSRHIMNTHNHLSYGFLLCEKDWSGKGPYRTAVIMCHCLSLTGSLDTIWASPLPSW